MYVNDTSYGIRTEAKSLLSSSPCRSLIKTTGGAWFSTEQTEAIDMSSKLNGWLTETIQLYMTTGGPLFPIVT